MRRKADICIETKRKLGKILELTGESEQNLEIDRQKLCNCKSFEPYASFQRLDRSGKGFISCKDIQNFMRYAQINFTGNFRDNGIGKVSDMCSKHLIKFFDSTG